MKNITYVIHFIVYLRIFITQKFVYLILNLYLCAESELKTLTEESEDSRILNYVSNFYFAFMVLPRPLL